MPEGVYHDFANVRFPHGFESLKSTGEYGCETTVETKVTSLALKHIFGHEAFRDVQEDVITSFLEQRSVFGVMATGQGKTLCYAVPAIIQTEILSIPLTFLQECRLQINIPESLRTIGWRAGYKEGEGIGIYAPSNSGKKEIEEWRCNQLQEQKRVGAFFRKPLSHKII